MKKSLIAMGLVSLVACANAADEVKTLETEEQKVSYSFGLVFGKRMAQDLPNLNKDIFMQGLADAYSGEPALLTDEQVGEILNQFQRDLQQRQMEKVQKMSEDNKLRGMDFLAENEKKEGIVTVEVGEGSKLQYKVLTEGKGPQPTASDTVQVHYTGSLIDGTVFDSSQSRGPVSFPLNGVIKGWTEALQLMQVGAKWQLFIPPELAYGEAGNRSIGPNETLIFEVELLDIVKK